MNTKCYICENEFDQRFESSVTIKILAETDHYIICPSCVSSINLLKLYIDSIKIKMDSPTVIQMPEAILPTVNEPHVQQKVGSPAPVGSRVTSGKGNWFSGTSWG